MVFGYDVPVKFSIEGACKTASVHLSGYFQPGPDDDDEDDDEDGDDDGMPQALCVLLLQNGKNIPLLKYPQGLCCFHSTLFDSLSSLQMRAWMRPCTRNS
jgi:hypothetical protein